MDLEKQKGYWVYSVVTIVLGLGLFAFLGYLLYDLIIKFSQQEINLDTFGQSIVTLFITIFLGGYFSKALESRNNKKMELFKIRANLSIRIIDLMGCIIRNEEIELSRQLLINESYKVKIFFNDDILKSLNNFVTDSNNTNYNILIEKMKKSF